MAFLDREFIACLKCTQDCFNWHAGQVARPHIAPSFVSRVTPCSDGLRIPRKFSGSFLGKCIGEVTLEGPNGRHWYAELKRDKDMMILSDPGWSDFAKYHGLQNGDGLLITFLGRGIFKVCIFDTKGYEKGMHCQLFKPRVDACASKFYHNNQELQNSSNHMVDPHFLYHHPHHSQNLDKVLPEKASTDKSHHCQGNDIMGSDAHEDQIVTITNHYQSALIEENISHHEDHGQQALSLECSFEPKGLDDKQLDALDSFDASQNQRDGMGNGQEIRDQLKVCNEDALETDNNHDSALNKLNVNDTCEASGTSHGGQAFNEANCIDGGVEAMAWAICEGKTSVNSNVHDNEEVFVHIEQEPCHYCASAIALDGHGDDKESLMNPDVYDDRELMDSKIHDDKDQMMNTEHEVCQCCNNGLAWGDLGQEVAQEESHEADLMQEGRCSVPETERKFSASDTTKQQAAPAESISGCNSHKQEVFSQTSTRSRALMEVPIVSHNERWRLICEANAFKSQFPIARKSFRPSHSHKMVLPKTFVQNCMPKKDMNLTLTDPYGKDWPCRWLGGFRGSNYFAPCISAGWPQFAHAHQLKTRDILVFELIDTSSLHLKVHFFKPKANMHVLS